MPGVLCIKQVGPKSRVNIAKTEYRLPRASVGNKIANQCLIGVLYFGHSISEFGCFFYY